MIFGVGAASSPHNDGIAMPGYFPAAAVMVTIFALNSGCVAIGTGHCGCMSIADEIQELKKARDDGEITHDEFHIGMAALHSRTP